MVTVGSKKDAGSQVSFSDGQSHRDEKPNDRHGTSTTTKAPCNALNLPTPPKGVVVANQGLKPPNSNENPFKGISWRWVLTSYGTSTATIKKAVHFATDFGISMLQKCISNINTKLPGSVPSKSFTAESTVLQNRVAIARSGQRCLEANTPSGISSIFASTWLRTCRPIFARNGSNSHTNTLPLSPWKASRHKWTQVRSANALLRPCWWHQSRTSKGRP